MAVRRTKDEQRTNQYERINTCKDKTEADTKLVFSLVTYRNVSSLAPPILTKSQALDETNCPPPRSGTSVCSNQILKPLNNTGWFF